MAGIAVDDASPDALDDWTANDVVLLHRSVSPSPLSLSLTILMRVVVQSSFYDFCHRVQDLAYEEV
jgi:hypothetical protein